MHLAATYGEMKDEKRQLAAYEVAYEQGYLQSGAEIGIRYEYDHQDESFQDPENIEGARKPEYDLQHLRVWYQAANRKWEVAAWVENLTDEEYLTHNFPLPPFGNPGTVGAPRTYGVTGTYNFGG